MKRLVHLINLCIKKNIPFVTFSLPGESNIQTCIQHSGKFLMVEKFAEVAEKTGFVYAPFHRRTNYPVIFFEPETVIVNEDFKDNLIREISAKNPLYPDYLIKTPFAVSKEEYLQQAEKFIQAFTDQFTKAVLSRVKLIENPAASDLGNYFFKLQETYSDAFTHLIHIPGNGTWMGATPETLLRTNHETARTVALAGTKPKSQAGEKVEWREKEIEEQAIVREYIEGIFKEFGMDNFKQSPTRNQSAGNMVHLVTEFEFDAEILKNNLATFIEKLHPTPAVCGLPKETALDLIFQTEKHNREYYAGFCGPVNINDQTDLFVNLRCMKILPGKIGLYLGGGLTARSKPEDEWQETVLKTRTLMKVID